MQFFTGLRFEVEQASRGLSAIAELYVILDYCTVFANLHVKGIAGGNVSNRQFEGGSVT